MIRQRIGGYFKLEAGKADGSKRVLVDWFKNLVTDAGLNQIGIAPYITRAYVGTGNATPAFTDTAMASLRATSTTILSTQSGAQSAPPYFGSYTRTFRFAAGTVTGELREAGVGWNPGLFARALTVDNNGNPTTIFVLADEYIDLTYQLRFYPDLEDSISQITIGGTDHEVTIRPANITQAANNWSPSNAAVDWGAATFRAFDGQISNITSLPDGVESSGGTATNAAYLSGSYSRGGILSINGPSAVYQAGVASLVTPAGLGMGRFQIGFNPPVQKSATTTLRLRFSTSWQRLE